MSKECHMGLGAPMEMKIALTCHSEHPQRLRLPMIGMTRETFISIGGPKAHVTLLGMTGMGDIRGGDAEDKIRSDACRHKCCRVYSSPCIRAWLSAVPH